MCHPWAAVQGGVARYASGAASVPACSSIRCVQGNAALQGAPLQGGTGCDLGNGVTPGRVTL